MKISEAKALLPSDTVMIFIGRDRIEALVVAVEQEGPQKVNIDVKWVDSNGDTQEGHRTQISAYLTKVTAARIATRDDVTSPRREYTIINPSGIPADILRCAIRIDNWMKTNKHERWKLMAIQSRQD
jgi:hypothetical protein